MKNKALFLLLTLILICSFPLTASANSAEPPGMIILVTNAPDDLELELVIPGEADRVYVQTGKRMWEQYFRFYYTYRDSDFMDVAYIKVTSSEKSFNCPLPEELRQGYKYNSLFHLDYEDESLTVGKPAYREPLLISLRVALTLICEGIVFLLCGFRKKSSWIIFLLINLLTQGYLNLNIAGSSIYGSGYWVIAFVLFEFLIFIAEMILFALLVREDRWKNRIRYALLANMASLTLGVLIIRYLPI